MIHYNCVTFAGYKIKDKDNIHSVDAGGGDISYGFDCKPPKVF